jgi:hypothetical protein
MVYSPAISPAFRGYQPIPVARTHATPNPHHRSSECSQRINAALHELMRVTTTPLRARDIADRLMDQGLSFGTSDPMKSVHRRLSYKSWAVMLPKHGFWHRGRDYAPAGWTADENHVHDVPASVLRQVASENVVTGNEIERYRLKRAWVQPGGDAKALLEASLRFLFLKAGEPIKELKDIRDGLEQIGVPTPICRGIKLRYVRSLLWIDNIRGHGLWLKGRQAPAGLPNTDAEIRSEAADYLRQRASWVQTDEIHEHLANSGFILSSRAADDIPILRVHLNAIPEVEGRSGAGYRIRPRA